MRLHRSLVCRGMPALSATLTEGSYTEHLPIFSKGAVLSSTVTVVEVGPRDGLQSLKLDVSTELKIAMVLRLIDAGLSEIEVTSFAHPKIVPRLADAEILMARLARPPDVTLRALVPNRRGAERAIATGVDVLVGLLSASEIYSVRNQNMTIEHAVGHLEEIASLAIDAGVSWGCAVSMAFASPYEDTIDPTSVMELVERVLALKPADLYVADTIGRASPTQVAKLCSEVSAQWPELPLGVHLHGTGARGLACAVSAVRAGASRVEASVLGLGGPVIRSPGVLPAGNLATETLVRTLPEFGVDIGLDPSAIQSAADDVRRILDVAAPADAPPLADVRQLIADGGRQS
jgi:hydroxymethylglutaryl-CoA lyase